MPFVGNQPNLANNLGSSSSLYANHPNGYHNSNNKKCLQPHSLFPAKFTYFPTLIKLQVTWHCVFHMLFMFIYPIYISKYFFNFIESMGVALVNKSMFQMNNSIIHRLVYCIACSKHFILIHAYLVVFLGCMNGDWVFYCVIQFTLLHLHSSGPWRSLKLWRWLWILLVSLTLISITLSPLATPSPSLPVLHTRFSFSFPPKLDCNRCLFPVSSRLQRSSIQHRHLPTEGKSPGRDGDSCFLALLMLRLRNLGLGQQLTCLWFPFPQAKKTWVWKRTRKCWLFCMTHVWTVTLIPRLGNTTSWCNPSFQGQEWPPPGRAGQQFWLCGHHSVCVGQARRIRSNWEKWISFVNNVRC